MPEKPRKQTRRSISVSAGTYSRLKVYGEATNRSLSSIVEEAIEAHLPQSAEGAARLALIRRAVLKRQNA